MGGMNWTVWFGMTKNGSQGQNIRQLGMRDDDRATDRSLWGEWGFMSLEFLMYRPVS
jgi:hypothetical protein